MKTFLFLLSTILSLTAISQDLIITYSGDSMNVKINRIYSDKIQYSIGDLKQTIDSRNVSSFQKNYYAKPVSQAERKSKDKNLILHFGANYSWSYRFAKIPVGYNKFMTEYIKKLKSGYSYGFDIGFFLNEQTALGFTYNRYNSSMRYDNVVYQLTELDTAILGVMSDDISITYYAPTLYFKFANFEESIRLLLSLSIGVTKFEDKGETLILDPNDKPEMGDVLLRGESIGLGLGMSVDFRMDKNIYLGPKIDLFTGTIETISYKDKYGKKTFQVGEKGESLARISLGGTLRCY